MRNLSAWIIFLIPTLAFAAPTLTQEQEARAQALFHQLHCVVCSGQSLAGSDARIAQDMRSLVREKITDGESDQAIQDYLVERYGEGILMAPPLSASNMPIWLAPLLIVLAGGVTAWRTLFRKPTS